MQGRTRRSRRWRSSAALIGIGLAAGCSVYQPLDRGSTVPWAAAARGGDTGSARSGAVAALARDTYRVRSGDRLGGVADRFGLSATALAEANDLAPPYVIRVGQELRVPAQAPGAGPRATMVAQREAGSTAVAAIDVAPLQPKPGVSAAGARQKSGDGGRQIATLEPKTLPARPTAAAPRATAAVPARPKPEKPAAASGASAPAGYTVRSGETLSGIAERLDVGLSELAKANGIKPPYRVNAGQQLRVPGGGEAYRTTVVDLGNPETPTVRLATGKPPPLQGHDFLWPVNGKVIGKYGPIDQWRRRDGIDIAAPRGAPVLAAQEGIVAYAGSGIRSYGQMILLRHDQGYITTYAHNASLLVEVGDVVRRGQVIARVGDSGEVTQNMLHFELRKGRQPIDPETRLVHDDKTLAQAD
jgi:murein DD-endopeptidase MepM/ murein hydrolase activator NlpD